MKLIDACAGLTLTLALVVPSYALAHGGGTDASGCHTNRKTGDHHCHGGKADSSSRSPSKATARQIRGAYGSGGGAFANCSAARAAGAAPVRRGDPGYGSHLDRDNDGIGCER